MISKPLLSGLVYMYLFNQFIRPEYQGSNDNQTNFVIGGIVEILCNYLSNPLSTLFGISSGGY